MRLERGKLDAIFLADTPAITDRIEYRSFMSMEPTIVLATIAASTEHIGLIATASTTYNIARRFVTLDHASGGRSGWNAVTILASRSRQAALPNRHPRPPPPRRTRQVQASAERIQSGFAAPAV